MLSTSMTAEYLSGSTTYGHSFSSDAVDRVLGVMADCLCAGLCASAFQYGAGAPARISSGWFADYVETELGAVAEGPLRVESKPWAPS